MTDEQTIIPLALPEWPSPHTKDDFDGGARQELPVYVGSSDVGAILGHSKWATPGDAWARIINLVPRYDQTDNNSQLRGRMFEDAIINEWSRRHHPKSVTRGPSIKEGPLVADDGWRCARPDWIATMQDDSCVYVECKSTRDWEGWGTPGTDYAPKDYRCQAAWQMSVGWDSAINHKPIRVDIAAFCPLDDGYREYPIPYGPVVPWIHKRIEQWMREHVWCDVPRPPQIPSLEMLGKIYPNGGYTQEPRVWREPDAEAVILRQKVNKIDDAMEILQAKRDRYVESICAKIGDAYGIKGVGSWGHREGKVTLDTALLEIEQPQIFEKYKRTGKPFRVFLVSKPKQ